MDFASRLKKLRLEKSMGQKELADEMNLKRSTISMWESGKRYPSRENMEWLSDIFNVDLDYLYCKTDIRQKIHFDGDGHLMLSVSDDELLMIETYRQSDDTTKEMVDRLLNYHQKLYPLFRKKGDEHDT